MSVVHETPEEHLSEHKKDTLSPEINLIPIAPPSEASVYEMCPSSDEDEEGA